MKLKTIFTVFAAVFVSLHGFETYAQEAHHPQFKTMIEKNWRYDVQEGPESPWRFTYEEVTILSRLMMAEAEGEGDIGKLYVLQTVLNRVASPDFPDTIKEVVFQEVNGVYQFSPVEDGRLWEVEPDEVCYEILADVQAEYYDNAEGVLYFCENSSNRWHKEQEYLFTYKNHSFYR